LPRALCFGAASPGRGGLGESGPLAYDNASGHRPVEGESANDYDYRSADPVNFFDLAGTWGFKKWWHKHWKQVAIEVIVAGAAIATGGIALVAYEAAS